MKTLAQIQQESASLEAQMAPLKAKKNELQKQEHEAVDREYPNADWKPYSEAPEGVTVLTKIDDSKGVRNVTTLKRQRNLWFYPDGSMYVYYTPTHFAFIS